MSRYLTLLRVMMKGGGFKASMGAGRSKRANAISLAVVLLILGVTFGGMCVFGGISLGAFAFRSGAEAPLFTIVLTAVESIILLLGVVYLLSVMYFSKDNEFLLSLPVKNSTVFLAKLTTVYIYLFAFNAFFMLFLGIPYGVTAHLSYAYYLVLVLSLFLTPLVSIFISTLLSFPLMYVASYFKKSRKLATIGVIVGVALFAGLYIGLYTGVLNPSNMGSGTEQPTASAPAEEGGITDMIPGLSPEAVAGLERATKGIFFNSCFAGIGIRSENLALDWVSLIGSYAAFAGLTYLMSALLYRRGMAKQLESGGEVVTKKRDYTALSPTKALFKKEMRVLFRTPVLLFYALFELVFPVVLVIIVGRAFTSIPTDSTGMESLDAVFQAIRLCVAIFFGLVLGCSMNYAALTSVSREGKNFYLMKIIPVPILKQLEVKGLLSYVFPVVSLLVITIYLGATGALSAISAIGFLLFTGILAYGFTYYQVGLDVKKPRLNFDNIAQTLQNNTNALVCMGVNMLYTIGAIGVVIGFTFLAPLIANPLAVELIIWAILIVAAAVSAVLFRRSYLKNVITRFERIEP